MVMIDDDSRESIVLGGPPQGGSVHPPAHEEQTVVMPQVVVVLPCVFVHVRVLFCVRAVLLRWAPALTTWRSCAVSEACGRH